MNTSVTLSYTVALFFLRLSLIFCSAVKHNDSELAPKYVNGAETKREPPPDEIIPISAELDPESEPLSSEIFPHDIIELLSPNIFSQPDPVLYFIKLIANISNTKVKVIGTNLGTLLWRKKVKFPPRYLPYAVLLTELLNCRRYLEDVKNLIKRMQDFSDSRYSTVQSRLLSPELADLFSGDIFSDPEPPSQLLMKLTKVPEDKLKDLRVEMRNVFDSKRFTGRYLSYAKELRIIIMNFNIIPRLRKSIAELRSLEHGASEKQRQP